MDSAAVKRYGLDAGAAAVGIASAADLDSAPEGYRPSDVLEGCRSVVVLGMPFSEGSFSDAALYTEVRSATIERTNEIVKDVAKRMKADGCKVKTVTGIGGKYVDGMTRGPISLKHAAEAAGLGVIGKNYLLISPEFGTRLWFCAVLTDAELVPDERLQNEFCGGCSICVEACPGRLLDDIKKFGKKECAKHSFKMVNKKWGMDCFLCRTVCPYRFGKR
jgi:epoxyqueuosine reductase QueG